jgi:hypothetical protein
MNKMGKSIKNLMAFLCIGATAAGVIGGVMTNTQARAENNPFHFSSEIRAVTPYEGATLNFNTHEINSWWSSEGVDVAYLNSLYEYTVGHQEFLTCVNYNDAEHLARLVELYKENDAFQPTNNVLKWTDDLKDVSS